MTAEDESMLELFGALTTCLSRVIALTTLPQLARFETEVLELLQNVGAESASTRAFRSVLREIEGRRALLAPQ
ncbi:hypothetical protein JI752_018715 [Lysobacter sp. MMG2]|uniref:hypothetical protein n=1 Tax=Lysobacter sp. MMG2 TaxID=2801338 RepID=UPI001C24463D|nr:hypothetical protein [Lysobacter sp. MMG2]MBU8978185.1 hypothetical protein [Lysobacter sp. MMG2]